MTNKLRAMPIAALLLLLPSLAMAIVQDDKADSEAEVGADGQKIEAKAAFPVSAVVIYDNSLGLGTFVANEYARNPSWSMSLSLRPSITLFDKLRLILRADVAKNLTTSFQGNYNSDASGESYIRQMTVSDLQLIASYPTIYKEPVTGIRIGASLTTYFPISMRSRSINQVLALRPSLSAAWGWEGLSLRYAFYFKKNFNTTTNPTHNVAYLGDSLQFRPGGPEDLGNGEIALGDTRNTSHLVYNYVEAGYTFFDKVSATAGLFVINSFKYTQPLSEFSSQYATQSGQADATWGFVDISYQAFDNIGFSIGLSSYQPAFTADNKYLRFPFFDFVGPGNNYTSFYFDVVGSI